MSRLSKDVPVEALGRRVVVREMDVSEIRAHLAAPLAAEAIDEIDVPGMLLFPDATFRDIQAMSDLTDEELGRLAPSEIRVVLAACKEVNPDFFGLFERLRKMG